MSDALQFESDFQLIGSTVRSFSIENSFVHYIDNPKINKNFNIGYRLLSLYESEEVPEKKRAIVHLPISLELSEEKAFCKIGLTLEGCFEISSTAPDDLFKEMLSINGASTLYALARAFILATTSQAFGGDKLILPMINFVQLSEQFNKEVDCI